MQSKRGSLIEASLNTASGFAVSFVIWQTIAPWFGYTLSYHDNFIITSIFTVASIIRSYLWRRFFNGRIIRANQGADAPRQ